VVRVSDLGVGIWPSRTERFSALNEEMQDLLLDISDMGLAYEELGIEEDRALAALRRNENFQVLRGIVLRQRDSWIHNFARGMALSPLSVDQREVDEKRGYFKGAVYYVQNLPRIAERRLEKKEE
jgi:hypothetical protein